MPKPQLSAVFVKKASKHLLDSRRLLRVLKDGGELNRLPPTLPGTRLRAVHYYGETALFGALTAITTSDTRRLRVVAASLEYVPTQVRAVLSAVPVDASYAYPESLALALARLSASAVHARLAIAGRPVRPRPPKRKLADAERHYRRELARLRKNVADGRRAAVLDVLQNVADPLLRRLVDLAPSVSGSKSDAVDAGRTAVRFGTLARRVAMLAAAAVLLDWRFRQGRAASGRMQHAARSRRVLVRKSKARALPRVRLDDLPDGHTVVTTGRIDDLAFVKRPDKPFTRVVLKNGGGTIHVPFKNARRLGWQAGVAILVRAKIARKDGQRVAEGMFEGPGTHQKAIWEDWLAVLTRPAYDLYPETLDADWSLTTADGRIPPGDLMARLS
jgi:hypothetical protein